MKTPAATLNSTSLQRKHARPKLVVVRSRNASWQTVPQWQAFLSDAGTLNWFELTEQCDRRIVKHGDGRTIWRVSIGNRVVYAKVATTIGLGAIAKQWFNLCAHQREWRALLRAHRLGVSTVLPIALGFQLGKPRRTVILTEGNPDSVSLDEYWRRRIQQADDGGRAPLVRHLIAEIAELFAVSHEKGFIHGDSHPKNILLDNQDSNDLRSSFVDLADACFYQRPVPLGHSLQSLAQLDRYFHRVATPSARLRFLNHYFECRPLLRVHWQKRDVRRAWLLQLRNASRQHGIRLARTRDRRINQNNAYFVTTPWEHGWRLKAVLKLARRHVFPESDVADRTIADWRQIMDRVLPQAAGSETGPLAINEEGLRCEVQNICGLGARITASILGPEHRRRFKECHKQRHRDIDNRLVLAYVEHRARGLIDKTLIIQHTKPAGDRHQMSAGNHNRSMSKGLNRG